MMFMTILYKKLPNKLKNILLRLYRKNLKNEMMSKEFHCFYKQIAGVDAGFGSYGYMQLPRGSIIGNYCSIADGVKYLSGNHPMENVSTSAIFYNPSLGEVGEEYDIDRKVINIGNDVWIGANVLITNGCTYIGNGAIIGAGAIVTKNVDPYTIVVGNPAHVLRKRFSDEVCYKLEESRWWELDHKLLLQYLKFMNNPLEFAEKILAYRNGN